MKVHQNDFVRSLLALQQDGSGAISSPANWLSVAPLLRVETPAIRKAIELSDLVWSASENEPYWHFFVGAPGNGKSMATREFAVSLREKGAEIFDEDGGLLSAIEVGRVPSVLDVRKDKSGGRLIAKIAQDASVVADPFTASPNPGREFFELLIDCAKKRVSLIACTNRGVLEQAAAIAAREASSRDPSVARVVAMLAAAGSLHSVSESVAGSDDHGAFTLRVTSASIDSGSLFSGQPIPLDELISEAISQERWNACFGCPAITHCPFHENRKALSGKKIRNSVLRLLEDAELIEGQPLVFREATALVSLVLAGCSVDYAGKSPCEWVGDCIENGRWFHLAARRLHMIVFSAFSPLGLDEGASGRVQLESLRSLMNRTNQDPGNLLGDACGVPSTQVGINRLLGGDGAMRQLDVLLAPLSLVLAGKGLDVRYPDDPEYVGEIESACFGIWERLEEGFEEDFPQSASCMESLSRWRSAHTLRCAALCFGTHAWLKEMDEYRSAIGIPEPPRPKERVKLKRLVENVLDNAAGRIRVAAHVAFAPESNANALSVGVDWEKSHRSRSLLLKFDEGVLTGGQTVRLSALAFIWLSRRHEGPLHDSTFPTEWLNSAREALVRAASARNYSRQDGFLEIVLADGGKVRVHRWDDELEVES